jgi:hypothetical protein
MGMEQTVTFTQEALPAWPRVRDFLTGRGFPVEMRMIDGELAFPDEAPPDNWRELRLGTPQGMVTLRREAHDLRFVTWGNADVALRQAWNALAWAYAEVGGGRVLTPGGPLTAQDFQRTAELPTALAAP